MELKSNKKGGRNRDARSFSRYRWAILAVAVMAHAAVVMGAMALAPLAPFLIGDLVSSRTELGMMVSVLLVGGAIGSAPGGWLADRSPRWALVGGQALLGVMLLWLTQVPSFQASLVPLFLGGLGFGALLPAMARAVASWFPAGERAMALGIAVAAAPVGNVLIAASLPVLAEAWGWRQALLPVAVIALASGLVSSLIYRPSPREQLSRREEAKPRTRPWATLKQRDTWLLGLVAILLGAAEHSFRTYFLLHLKEVALMSVVIGGWYLALAHGSGFFGRIGWGVVSDRWFAGRREGVLALLPLLAALATLSLGLGWGSPWVLPFVALLFGLTGGGWVGLWMTMLSERASSGSAGGEMGLGMTFTYIGVILGPVLFGRGLDLTGSYGTMWLALTAITVLASPAALLLRVHPKVREAD